MRVRKHQLQEYTLPLTLSAAKKWYYRHCSRCICKGSLAVPRMIAQTRDMLSKEICIKQQGVLHPCSIIAMPVGAISLTDMRRDDQVSGHCTWNYWLSSLKAPQSSEPDASAVFECDSMGWWMKMFNLGRKQVHQCRSNLKSAVSLTWCQLHCDLRQVNNALKECLTMENYRNCKAQVASERLQLSLGCSLAPMPFID